VVAKAARSRVPLGHAGETLAGRPLRSGAVKPVRPTAVDYSAGGVRRLPAAVMNDLAGRAAVGIGDGPQRPVRRVAHAEEEGDIVIAGYAQDLTGRILVADRGMAGADAEVGGGDGHGVGGLPEVVVVEEAGTVALGMTRAMAAAAPAMWPAPCHTVDSARS
jgi:hypothetical protein